MSRIWTRGAARAPLLGVLLALLILPVCGCGGDDTIPNVIVPIRATAVLDPDPGGDPEIYLQKVSEVGDLVTVNLGLRTTATPVSFYAFNLVVTFDPSLLTVGGIGYAGTVLCGCDQFDLACPDNVMPKTRTLSCQTSTTTRMGSLILGAAVLGGAPEFNITAPADVILVTLAFRAGVPTPPGGTRIDFPSDPSQPDGNCEILTAVGPDIVDLGIPCATGFTLTARR